MKSLLVAAFILCSCVLVNAQELDTQNESPSASIKGTEETQLPPVPPEPLFLIEEGGIKREISKEELEKLNITEIAYVEMLMDNESIKEYGEKGQNGVMIISLRKD